MLDIHHPHPHHHAPYPQHNFRKRTLDDDQERQQRDLQLQLIQVNNGRHTLQAHLDDTMELLEVERRTSHEALTEVASLRAQLGQLHEEMGQMAMLHLEKEMEAGQRQAELDALQIELLDARMAQQVQDQAYAQLQAEVHDRCTAVDAICSTERERCVTAEQKAALLGKDLESERAGRLVVEQKLAQLEQVRPAMLGVLDTLAKMGDHHCDQEDVQAYAKWQAQLDQARAGLPGLLSTELWTGARDLTQVLVPSLIQVYQVACQTNETLRIEYDKLAAHAKQLEREMAQAEDVYNKQLEANRQMAEVNRQMGARLDQRTAIDSVRVEGVPVYQQLIEVSEQKRQLQEHIQGLERTVGGLKPLVMRLREEKAELERRLLTAEQSIVPPRSLIFVKDAHETMRDDVAAIRERLGLADPDDERCDLCVLYLGQAKEAERQLGIARATMAEEQRRLVRLAEDQKESLEARRKTLENQAADNARAAQRETARLAKQLGDSEAKSRLLVEQLRTSKDEAEKQASEQRTAAERRLAAKNSAIEDLQRQAQHAAAALPALQVMSALLQRHYASDPAAQRFQSALEDCRRFDHQPLSDGPLLAGPAYHRLVAVTNELASPDWIAKAKASVSADRAGILHRFKAAVDAGTPRLKKFVEEMSGNPTDRELGSAMSNVMQAWYYAERTLLMTQ
jgi:hypothetical protein